MRRQGHGYTAVLAARPLVIQLGGRIAQCLTFHLVGRVMILRIDW